jgi:lysophospholipase L1-like esterase
VNYRLFLKEIKPYHVVLFLLAVLLFLSPVAYFIPKEGWSIGGSQFHFFSKDDFLHPRQQEKKDISHIVAEVDTSNLEVPVTETLPFDAEETIKEATLKKHINNSKGKVGAPDGGSLSAESTSDIFLTENARIKLRAFFKKMDRVASEKTKIHILHYGDSQIEGDRMTSYIRQRIQNQFGGNGPGLIPAMNVYQTYSYVQTYSANFIRHTCFGGPKLKNRKYGAMGSAARFTEEYYDSAAVKSMKTEVEGWIEIEPSFKAQSRARTYNNAKLFYTSCIKPCAVKVYQNGELIHQDSLIRDGNYHVLPLNFSSHAGKLRYVFSSSLSPTICGFSLEGDYGIQVDNIAMRGSSGTFFGSIDPTSLSKMYQDLNSELILLQFGGNSVPFFKDSSAVRKFASFFQSQIRTVKKIHPSAAIIVIGPSDMSKFSNGIYETYKFLPYCVAQMRKVAGIEGAGYWDLFGVMGGKNSMPSWVDNGLAGKDYIHFTPKGASIASQLFYDAFEAEFAKWKLIATQ